MIGKLLRSEETNAALVVALTGTVAALVASGPGQVSLKRVVAGALSNPVPRREMPTTRAEDALLPARDLKAAA